jgi:hypothetical protein
MDVDIFGNGIWLIIPTVLMVNAAAFFIWGTYRKYRFTVTVCWALVTIAFTVMSLRFSGFGFICTLPLTYIIALKLLVLYLIFKLEK